MAEHDGIPTKIPQKQEIREKRSDIYSKHEDLVRVPHKEMKWWGKGSPGGGRAR